MIVALPFLFSFRVAAKQPPQCLAVKGYKRIKIGVTAESFSCGYDRTDEYQTRDESPYLKQTAKYQYDRTGDFYCIAKLKGWLSEV